MEVPEIILRIYGSATIISFLLYMIEVYSMMLSSFFLFRFGVKVKTTHGVKINLERFEIGMGYTTEHAKFTRINENTCVFCHRFGFFRFNTPFPIKGEILQNGSENQLTWRIPLGSTLFFSFWLLGWISPVFGIFQFLQSQVVIQDFAFSIMALLLGLIFLWAVCAFSFQLEQKRARLALSELLLFSLHQ